MLDMIMNYTIDYVQAYSNIVEYAEDVLYLIKLLINKDKLYLNKYYNYIIKIKVLDELTKVRLDCFFYFEFTSFLILFFKLKIKLCLSTLN